MLGFHSIRAFPGLQTRLKRFVAVLSIASIVLAAGRSEPDKKNRASNDVRALQDLIDVPVKLASAKWEIFGTPEYEGGVPGPTDYMTLVAEVEPVENTGHFTAGAGDANVYLVPEVARPWISSGFRSMLETNKNANISLAAVPGCHAYRTTIKKSGRPVGGFSCMKANRVLVYLSLY